MLVTLFHRLINFDQKHVRCFGNTIHLEVQKAMEIPGMTRALVQAKGQVSHFHNSVKSTNVLHQKQKDQHDEQNLIQDVPTR